MERGITRRQLLSTTVLAVGAAALAFASRPARAFSVQPMDAEAQGLYLAACSTRDGPYHRQLVADAKKQLEGRATEAQIEAALAQMTCPVCGCPVTAF